MRTIYKTENPIEAHIITHMLEQNGIMAQVIEDHSSHMGHFIGGGTSARISVINDESEDAIELIKNWKEETEEESQALECEEPTRPSSYLLPRISKEMLRWIGFAALAIWLLLTGL